MRLGSDLRIAAFVVFLACGVGAARAQTVDSTYLTDKIYQGSGTIDLLKDVSSETLAAYFNGTSTLMLAVDVNENASGMESSTSMAVAIRAVTLQLTTTSGDFSFSDVFTNTTALITDSSGVTREYYTLFGQSGSSNLTSSTTGFDLSRFDDLLEVRNVEFGGTILSAQLSVSFVQVALRAGENEAFFDYSGGFEDFALLDRADAVTLEFAGIGLVTAPSGITYEEATVSETILAVAPSTDGGNTGATGGTTSSGGSSGLPAPAAPLPPTVLLLAAGALILLRPGGRAGRAP